MPRKALGDRPMTPAERQARQRAKHEERARLAEEAVQFVLRLNPAATPVRGLAALQRRLQEEQR